MIRKNQDDIALLAHLMRQVGIAAETNHRRDLRQELMDRLGEMRQCDSYNEQPDLRCWNGDNCPGGGGECGRCGAWLCTPKTPCRDRVGGAGTPMPGPVDSRPGNPEGRNQSLAWIGGSPPQTPGSN